MSSRHSTASSSSSSRGRSSDNDNNHYRYRINDRKRGRDASPQRQGRGRTVAPPAKRRKEYERRDYARDTRSNGNTEDIRKSSDSHRGRAPSPPSRSERRRSRSASRSDSEVVDCHTVEDAVKPVIVPPVKKTPLGLSGRPKSPIRAESPRRRKYSHSSESSSVSSSSESSESEEEQQPVEDKMAIDEAKKPYVVPALTNGILALKEQGCDASTAIDSKGFIKRTYLLGSQPNAILYAFSYFQPIGGARGLSYNIYNPDVHATHCSKSTQAFFVVPFNEINKCAVFFAQEVDLLGGIASIVNRLDQLSADNLLLPDGIRTIGLAFNFSTFSYTLNVTYQSIRSDELIKRTFTVSTGDLATVIEKFSPTDKRKRQW